jgi:hypothetical protein
MGPGPAVCAENARSARCVSDHIWSYLIQLGHVGSCWVMCHHPPNEISCCIRLHGY